MKQIEFISYDGKSPSLCCGTLVLKIDGVLAEFRGCLVSGGSCNQGEDEKGPWEFLSRKKDDKKYHFDGDDINVICALVNEYIPYGCCGGCI